MSEPSREHVEAVARAIDPTAWWYEATSHGWDRYRTLALSGAGRVLRSTDPAVHAATLDALVQAGVLTERPYPRRGQPGLHRRVYLGQWEAIPDA